MKLFTLYPQRKRRSWILRFLVGMVLLGGALIWWLRWEPRPDPDEGRPLPLPGRRASAAAGTNGAASTRSGVPGPPRVLGATTVPAPGVSTESPARTNSFVPNPNLLPAGSPGLDWQSRPPRTVLEAQIALARLGISPGSIDGTSGPRTQNALRAFQRQRGLPASGVLDTGTRRELLLTEPPYTHDTVTAADLGRLMTVGSTWLEKSRQTRLDFETLEELMGERWQADPDFIRQLNQDLSWGQVGVGTRLRVPNVRPLTATNGAAWVRIRLGDRTLQAYDDQTNLLAHFPCSVARSAEKRPLGELRVEVIIRNPNYTFDPANFPRSEEARQLQNKLLIPPGPNNPVGLVWIGLDRPGYGIHGTPRPDQVGQAESLGCFRLANWNAEYLAQLAWPGMPVKVEP